MSNLEYLRTASPEEVAAFLASRDDMNAPCCICAFGTADNLEGSICDCKSQTCAQGVRLWLDMEAREA
jgi:hypothetical protein